MPRLLPFLLAATLGLGLSSGTLAKGGRSTHGHNTAPHASETHESGNGSGIHVNLPRGSNSRSEGNPGAEPVTAPAAATPAPTAGDQEAARDAERKAQRDAAAAQRIEQQAAEEQRKHMAAQAAIAAAEEEKRRVAAASLREQEQQAQARRQRQAAWEARCNIQPVMSDLEIATCKEVWTRPAR